MHREAFNIEAQYTFLHTLSPFCMSHHHEVYQECRQICPLCQSYDYFTSLMDNSQWQEGLVGWGGQQSEGG